jgi:ferredoxin
MKHPLALGMGPLIRAMVPLQGTREPLQPTGFGGDTSDPKKNADAIKALGHYLGADFVGICAAEPWMYYATDDVQGKPIEPYHPYAVVMLIDQGYETMDGASGDDWISASQSMRAYLRGAEMAGIMGSKSVVFTTELPMTVDRPIDFGLQDFCSRCRKCARECPCNSITFGPKVMFNGYEIWKADVDKCTKYRVTQQRGSACGRCMKMCPWNREDTVAARNLVDLSINHPDARPAIIAMDDQLQNGKRNLIKKWWFDLEVIDGAARIPPVTNERDLNLGRDAKLIAAISVAI